MKLTKYILSAFVVLMVTFGVTPAVSAACPSGNTPKGQVLKGVGQAGSRCNDSGVPKTIKAVTNILSYFVGILAVIMIIIAGFKYITSNGNTESVASAKSTLIYALIGIAIAVLAQFFVSFVLSRVAKFGLLML